MSLDYTSLQAVLLDYSARADLTAQTAGFVRLAEGMIRREVDAMETRTTLVEADRAADGLYDLPSTIQRVRAVYAANGADQYVLENVGLHGIKMLPASADVLYYAVSDTTIEFRGVPATDAEFEIVGMGWPDPLDTTATNDLLTYHEALYVYGGLYFLYTYTQDGELALNALQTFADAVRKVNAFNARKTGGGSVLPAYNFGHTTVSRGY